jgi:Poly (ADP-ribose) glycohydrolase (PARG)
MFTVIAIDALCYRNKEEQFKDKTIRRELNKAFVGFSGDGVNDRSPIASGLWGCGAFNGIAIRSAVIQHLACAATNRNLVFYTNGDAQLRDGISQVFGALSEKKVTVAYGFKLLKRYYLEKNMDHHENLIDFLIKGASSFNVKNSNSSAQMSSIEKRHNKTLMKLFFPKGKDHQTVPTPPLSKESQEKLRIMGERRKEKFESFNKVSGNTGPSSSSAKKNEAPKVKEVPIKKQEQKSLIDALDMDFD